MIELVVALGIMMVLAAITAPKLLGMIEQQRLQSSSNALATFLQECRYRAEQDGQWYQILLDQGNASASIFYLDIAGNRNRVPGDPQVEIPAPITIPDPANGLPNIVVAGFTNANLLGATPLNVDTTPATWDCVHAQACGTPTQVAGLSFNERGLPCQVSAANAAAAATKACTNTTTVNVVGTGPPPLQTTAPVAWITYFAYPTASNGTLYSAVTVTPAGRIKVWYFQATGAGAGTWH
ncbi:MAG: prepilin-type N-terminal cleavage/methylation domain-containing protein [Acidobacteria bacterium]|nr:prepilin-type N-terminal cleavage/methylation domain-containing protein [Acidobacteriota bacterium]